MLAGLIGGNVKNIQNLCPISLVSIALTFLQLYTVTNDQLSKFLKRKIAIIF